MADPRNKSRRPAVLTPYQLLGVSPYATLEEIRQAFRDLARRYHPDANPPSKKAWAEDRMRRLNETYDLLSDPIRRAKYDAAHPPPPPAPPPLPIEPIDPTRIDIDLRGDPEMRRRAIWFWIGIALALALIAGGIYFGLVGADNAPDPLVALGEFVSGERMLNVGGQLTLSVGELALFLLGVFLTAIPLAWLWLRR